VAVSAWLTTRLRYEAQDLSLFLTALTHRSWGEPNNERLEFLGDSALNLVVSAQLYREFPTASEGDLSRLRARVVSEEPLAQIAQTLQLGNLLRLGSGELKTGGFRRHSILADSFEALCGAIYLDRGIETLRAVIEPLFEPLIAALPDPATLKDAKTRLQEYLQGMGAALPVYAVERVAGEPHAQTFLVSCSVAPLRIATQGSGASRRRAEQQAAQLALAELGVDQPLVESDRARGSA
jgi:ribonuclease-3